jgi:nucleoside-diphosphate-sugar epimerase
MASDLCRRVAELPNVPNPKLKVGSLSGLRGFIDVRDAVKIFADLSESKVLSPYEVFNLSSEGEKTVEEFLKTLLKISQKSPHIEISETQSLNRFQGPKISVEKLKKQLPGVTFHPLHETIKDMWEVEKRAHGK